MDYGKEMDLLGQKTSSSKKKTSRRTYIISSQVSTQPTHWYTATKANLSAQTMSLLYIGRRSPGITQGPSTSHEAYEPSQIVWNAKSILQTPVDA